jgi:D-sedoheptulose 7-phosphate isomerase
LNFNNAELITCYANDYGHENWIKECIKTYFDKGDIVILISSSGESKNHMVAAKYCKQNKIFLITLTGFNFNNPLCKLGNINFSVNSSNYNHIELTHNIWLLLLCDFIAKKKIN